MNYEQTDRLAHVAAVLRPTWPLASLQTWFASFAERNPHRTYTDTMLALVACALDPATEKPARLEQAGPWWTDPRQTSAAPQIFSGPQLIRCTVRGHTFHTGEPCDGKPLTMASPEVVAEARRAARETAAAAKATEAARRAPLPPLPEPSPVEEGANA